MLPRMECELDSEPVETICELLERMRQIESCLPRQDGVAAFNHVYRRVTAEVLKAIHDGAFENREFVTQLDVQFGNLYLAALDGGAKQPVPRAWQELLKRRSDPHISRLQFALAGMNAHINRDLPVAVVSTCQKLASDLDTPGWHTDYARVDGILEQLEPTIRAELLNELPPEQRADVADLVADWTIVGARRAAWTNARVLWRIRSEPGLRDDYLGMLDWFVARVGRGLLRPLV